MKRFWNLLIKGDLQIVAAALSFSTILSFIPFIAVSLATIKYLDGFVTIYPKAEALILNYFQDPTGKDGVLLIAKFFKRIQIARLGIWGFVGLILTSMMLVNDMERGIHKIWNLKDRRPLHKRLFMSWIFLLLFPFSLAVYVGITSLKYFANGSSPGVQFFNFLITVACLTFIYKTVPNTQVRLKSAILGGLAGAFGLFLLFRSFKWLTHNIFMLGKMYGSFAAFPTLLLWILFTWILVLLGAMITASLERKE